MASNPEKLRGLVHRGSFLAVGPLSAMVEKFYIQFILDLYKNDPKIDGIVWICFRIPPKRVRESIFSEDENQENIVFIDMISEMMGLQKEKNTIYCHSPTDYNCMFMGIDSAIEKIGRCIVVFDDLNAILSYDSPDRLIKVLRNMNNKIPQKESIAAYMLVEGSVDSRTETAIQTTMDVILKVGEEIEAITSGEIERYKKWYEQNWEDLKTKTWHDVFSLKEPILYMPLLVTMAVNVFLLILLVFVISRL
ncbi:MAG: hypothetical protein ACXQS7_01215 [Candidatus Syntropharchaeia archaeon]